MADGGSQARGPIRATAASLHHSHSNAGSRPTEQGLGLNGHPHGCSSGSFPLSHDRNSWEVIFIQHIFITSKMWLDLSNYWPYKTDIFVIHHTAQLIYYTGANPGPPGSGVSDSCTYTRKAEIKFPLFCGHSTQLTHQQV